MTNWQFDVICMGADLAAEVKASYRVRTLPVLKPRGGETGVEQLIFEVSDTPWYLTGQLESVVRARHGAAGGPCDLCGVWRWLPVGEGDAPPAKQDASWAAADAVASPEWFGDGWKAFRHFQVRRPLADLLVSANPRVWSIIEVADRSL